MIRREHGCRFGMIAKKRERKFKSDALELIHASAAELFDVDAIDMATMRGFDETCLSVPAFIAPNRIKQIRESQRVSQPSLPRPARGNGACGSSAVCRFQVCDDLSCLLR